MVIEELSSNKYNPGLDEISKEISGKIFKDSISPGPDVLGNQMGGKQMTQDKTECRDEQTCVALNEFLDHGYRPQDSINFAFDSSPNHLSLTFDTAPLGARDKMELAIRAMKFIMSEIQNIKNGY